MQWKTFEVTKVKEKLSKFKNDCLFVIELKWVKSVNIKNHGTQNHVVCWFFTKRLKNQTTHPLDNKIDRKDNDLKETEKDLRNKAQRKSKNAVPKPTRNLGRRM